MGKKNKKDGNLKLFILIFLAIVVIVGIVIYNKSSQKTEGIEEKQANVEQTKIEEKKEPEPEEEPEYIDETIQYENEYEEAILKRTNKNNDYKIIEINGPKYHGYLTAIYEPSRIGVATTSQLGKTGEFLVDISKKNNALLAINGGGFVDANFEGNGATPLGITISDGKYVTEAQAGKNYGIIGFDSQDKLVLGKYSVQETKDLGIRDAVTFGPYLIKDGKPVKDLGTAALGRAARTAIAQREDGIVMFLVLDGDRTKGQGAVYKDMIEILQKYGAVNAANLDGGTSTSMTVNSVLVNDPTSMTGEHRTREVSTAFILKPDESNNADYTIVADKIK